MFSRETPYEPLLAALQNNITKSNPPCIGSCLNTGSQRIWFFIHYAYPPFFPRVLATPNLYSWQMTIIPKPEFSRHFGKIPLLNHHHVWRKMVKTLGRLETSPQLHGCAPQGHERVVAVPTGLPWRFPGERSGMKITCWRIFPTRCYHLTCREGWLCTLPKHVASCMYWNSRWWCFSTNCILRRHGTLYWPRT